MTSTVSLPNPDAKGEKAGTDGPAFFLGVEKSLTGKRWIGREADGRQSLALAQRLGLAEIIGRVLVARRRAGTHLPGLLEFPGGKIRPGEGPAEAALRELEEETGLKGGRTQELARVHHVYPGRELLLTAFLVTGSRGEVRALGSDEVCWLHPGEITPADMPEANGPILERLRLETDPSRRPAPS